jgi:hypothetical protein
MADEQPKQEIPKSSIQKLKEGLLLKYEEKEISEPGYYAIGTLSTEAKNLQKQWQYANEILRIISELKLTVWLLDNLPPEENIRGIDLGPEDAILYYEGIFPELAHQLKDKIFGLVELLLGIHPNTQKTGKRLKKILEQARKIGVSLETELGAWHAEEEKQGIKEMIKGVLTVRTHHHHYLSKIPLNEFYQDVKISRIFLQDPIRSQLTDFGKTEMTKKGVDGLAELRDQAKQKMSGTLEEIEKNITAIADILISHFGLAYTPEQLADFVKKRQALDERLEIKNTTSAEKIPARLKAEMDKNITESLSGTGDLISAFYLIGSVPRGEFDPLFSDINTILIVKDQATKELLLQKLPQTFPVSIQVFTEAEFKDKDSLEAKKYRFICKYDGLLMAGADLIGKESFPKPGAELAWILNHDFLKKISVIEEWAQKNPGASMELVGNKSKEVLKLFFDAVYGVAITNDPQYIHNRRKRIDFIDAAFPQNEQFMKVCRRIFFSGGIGNLDGLIALIDKCKEIWMFIQTQLKPIVDKLHEFPGS